jgi:hypothetical protein
MSNSDSHHTDKPKLQPGPRTFFQGEWLDRITCKEFVEWVTDYFEDKLPADERKRFEAHLAECNGCPTYFEQIRATIQTVGKLSDTLDEVTPTAKQELLGVFKKWKAGASGDP